MQSSFFPFPHKPQFRILSYFRPTEPVLPIKSATNQLRELSQTILSAQTSISTPKAHAGVAVPMSAEELEKEMADMASNVPKPVNVKKSSAIETSTSKDGITTWILLSGTDATSAPSPSQKSDKIAKVKDSPSPSKVPNVAPPTTKNASKNKSKGTAKPATATTKTQSSEEDDFKQSTTVRSVIGKKKVATAVKAEQVTTSAPPAKTTSVPFLVLEAKDAEFNLPEDRAAPTTTKPKTKRPTKGNANKKKNVNKKKTPTTEVELLSDEEDTKNSTKTAVSKIKPKPMATQLYNFLAREIMPTVGVGLLGLVVTAGIAGYFLNPLGAIRRSYEAADRKEDLYYYNNEEYAGPGADGLSEEEVFGKVIAGMPSKGNTYRNAGVRYGNQLQSQRPNQFHQHGQQKYASATVALNTNNGPYARYRNVQAPQQQQTYSSSYNPHYQQRNNNPNVIMQKSIASQIYAEPQANTTTSVSTPTTTEEVIVVTNADSFSPSIGESAPSIVYSQSQHSYDASFMDNEAHSNELKHRTQFVVGSVINTDAVSSSKDDDETKIESKYPSIVMPEHGPRRRRRHADASAITKFTPDENMLSSTENTTPNSDNISPSSKAPESDTMKTSKLSTISALPFDEQLIEAEQQYAKLRKRYENYKPSDKSATPIVKEMKRLDYQMIRLRRVASEAKDILQYQSEMHFESSNTEIRELISQGLTQVLSDVQFVGELLDNPKLVATKMNDRAQLTKRVEVKFAVKFGSENKATDTDGSSIKKEDQNDVESNMETTSESTIEYTTTPKPSLFLGFLKMLELKSAFGVNVLRSIRPAFDRAVQEVFQVNQTAYNH